MENIVSEVRIELKKIIDRIQSVIPSNEPFNIAHNNWTFPGVSRDDLLNIANELLEKTINIENQEIEVNPVIFKTYIERLKFLSEFTLPNIWSNAAIGIPAFVFTMNGLKTELDKYIFNNPITDLNKLTKQIKSVEASMYSIQPKANNLAVMVERIESAFEAAEQLPTDMENLKDSRGKIEAAVIKTEVETNAIEIAKDQSEKSLDEIKKLKSEAESIIELCKTAYAASTSVGLAAAFSERSDSLNKSVYWWVAGLVIALTVAVIFGSHNVQSLISATWQSEPSGTIIVTRIFLSLLSIGGPIWFAWLATKQIGQRFRLSEDYAFKASISRAYEGFRSEASRIDKNLEAKLLASALSRLDEIPLRLVETETHGSPYHELLTSNTIKEALKTVPGLSVQIKNMAEKALISANEATAAISKAATKTASTEKTDDTKNP